tara:strand:+ start:2710 stop:3510 length:801 start_codon:yes stop_codon:yes gene_type:complete
MKIRKYIEQYSKDCDFKYPSDATRRTYKNGVRLFLEHFENEIQPKSISNEKIKEFLMTAKTHNTRKQLQCSINSFYTLTVKMPSKISSIPYPKKQKSLPRIIDTKHLIESINSIQNIKHKAILMTTYSCALRVSEVCNLKIDDIDSKRGIIHIKNAKGQKDRIVKLSDKLLICLRKYYKKHRPTEYLFNGQSKLKYTSNSCNKLVKKYIGSKYSMHHLRHSGATAMLENGTEINVIQKVLGHNSIKTTMIYTHVSNNLIQSVATPM